MTEPKKRAHDRFADMVIGDLVAASERQADVLDPFTKGAIARAIVFLETRLTDAAKAGCHHCGEGERGTPCWWCGLKN